DIILAACTALDAQRNRRMAAIILTGKLRPGSAILRVIHSMPVPVLFTEQDSYQVASKVHDIIVKTRPGDAEKISLIRDLIASNVDLARILALLDLPRVAPQTPVPSV